MKITFDIENEAECGEAVGMLLALQGEFRRAIGDLAAVTPARPAAAAPQDCNADQFLGQVLGGIKVTDAMVTAVQTYLAVCRRLADPCNLHFVEQQFDLAPLNPPARMFGTCDYVAYSSKRRELHVVDFKYGAGVWVPATANAQLHYYGLGAVLAIEEPVSSVCMVVVQPRFGKGDAVRSSSIDAVNFTEWSFELMNHARATQEPDAKLVAGDWCKFCPVKNSCVAHQNSRVAAAYHDFALADA